MNEQAAQLVDRVLPRCPYRQWVLTLPSPLARAVAYDAPLAAQVFGLLADELGRWYRRAARAKGISAPHAGCVLEVQRFADGALLYPHAHVIAPEGVFHETDAGAVRFVRLPSPKDADVEAIVGRVDARVRRLLARRAKGSADELEADHPHQLLLDCASLPPDGRVVGPNSKGTKRRRPRGKAPVCRSARRGRSRCGRTGHPRRSPRGSRQRPHDRHPRQGPTLTIARPDDRASLARVTA